MPLTNQIIHEALAGMKPSEVDAMDNTKCKKLLHEALDTTELMHEQTTHQDVDDMDTRNSRDMLKRVCVAAKETLDS